jgi:lipopolysaccharide/colanic/teichoic acid biosynthesis glycosyltransferase
MVNEFRMVISKSALLPNVSVTPRGFARTVSSKLSVELASEAAFMQTLRREVRRTERSGRPFLLALVSGGSLFGESGPKVVSNIVAAISSSTRETDCLGWYEQNATLGILLTEIGEADDLTVEVVDQKISSAIRTAVSPEEYGHLRVVIRVFPHPSANGDKGGWEEEIYRDLRGQQGLGYSEGVVKRVIDIAGSLLALLLFLPVFAVIAILVKVTSRGPVLFCQKRVGQYGKLFTFYKFRSMYADNDSAIHRDYVTKLIEGTEEVQQANGMYKLVRDPRVTPLGSVLRKSSLDELPQFMNVLIGDMSLVGPRPPVPYEFERYRTWHRRRVLEIKPGLTGLWQVKGRSRTTFDEMVRMDLHYARTQSLWLDLRIILQTPGAMFSGTGAI